MTLPTGAITMAQVATELGVTQTGINLNQSNVRTLAGKPSGAISMSDLQGKSSVEVASISAMWVDFAIGEAPAGKTLHTSVLRVTATFTNGSTLASAVVSGLTSTRVNSSTIDIGSSGSQAGAIRTFVITSSSGFKATYTTNTPVAIGNYMHPNYAANPSKTIGVTRVG